MTERTTSLLIFLVATVALVAAWAAADAFFLFFGGVLFAVFLRGITNYVTSKTNISDGWGLAITLFAITALVLAVSWVTFPLLSQQTSQLMKELPNAWNTLVQQVSQYDLGQTAVDQTEILTGTLSFNEELMPKFLGIASSLVASVAAFFIIFFTGIYLAISPRTYRHGVALLFPQEQERKVTDILLKVGSVLEWWLLGKLIAMVAVGIFTWLGLWALSIPLAPVLGLLAAVLTFIPNIGPVIAAIPPLLLALTQGPTTTVYVLLLVLLVQGLETYVLSPYVQKHTIALPPGLTLFVQVIMGAIFGGIAVTVASPLAAAGMVVFDELKLRHRRPSPPRGSASEPTQ